MHVQSVPINNLLQKKLISRFCNRFCHNIWFYLTRIPSSIESRLTHGPKFDHESLYMYEPIKFETFQPYLVKKY